MWFARQQRKISEEICQEMIFIMRFKAAGHGRNSRNSLNSALRVVEESRANVAANSPGREAQ